MDKSSGFGPMTAAFSILVLVVGALTAEMVKSADEGRHRSPVRPHLRPLAPFLGAKGVDARPVRRINIAQPSPSQLDLSINSLAKPSKANRTALAPATTVCAGATTSHRPGVSVSKYSAPSQRSGSGKRRKREASSALRRLHASGKNSARVRIALVAQQLTTHTHRRRR
jgi:hypothetical protein